MCKIKTLSGASMRSEFSFFEIEAIKYAVNNNINAGQSYQWGASAELFTVTDKTAQTITVRREACQKDMIVYYGQAATTATATPATTATTVTTTTPTTGAAVTPADNSDSDLLNGIAALLKQHQAAQKPAPAAVDYDKIKDLINEAITAKVAEIEAAHTTTIKVNDGPAVKIDGGQHPQFAKVLPRVKRNVPVYLYGPAGTGKTTLASQVAKALGLNFYCVSGLQQKFEFEGFVDAGGKYQITDFYRAYTQGGVFMLDEIDSTASEVLVAFNNALANGFYTFPGEIGKVEAHPDFRVIAAGNTIGLGADSAYCGRFQLDASTRDRFAFIPVDYSDKIELQTAGNDSELVQFIHAVRSAIQAQGLNLTASPRALSRISQDIADGIDTKEALMVGLTNAWTKEDLCLLQGNIEGTGKYFKTFKSI